jgi:hypothetical protein
MFETAMQEELYELILGWLRQVPSSERRPREMLETTAMVISWAIFGPAVQWSRGDRYPTADEMSSRVMTIVVNALSDVIDSIPS